MPQVTINDIDIYYEIHGTGQPLVLIAGYTCDHFFWGMMLEELTKHFQVIVFDNRAVGQTRDNNSTFTVDTLAEDTINLISHLDLQRPHILGQSMGGIIAQIIARKYPEKINKLIILNSTSKIRARTAKALESLLNLRKADIDLETLIDVSMPWFFSSNFLKVPEKIAGFKSILLNNPYLQSLEDQERQFQAVLSFDSNPWLNQIKSPTCVIAAEDDIVILSKESKQVAEGITNAEFVMIPGGHTCPIEYPNAVNEAVLNFLQRS